MRLRQNNQNKISTSIEHYKKCTCIKKFVTIDLLTLYNKFCFSFVGVCCAREQPRVGNFSVVNHQLPFSSFFHYTNSEGKNNIYVL